MAAGRALGRTTLVVLLVTGLLGGSIAVAGATGHVEKIVSLGKEELPEGIAIDKRGAIFISIAARGELRMIPPGSSMAEPFGHIAGIDPLTDLGLLGLAVDAPGNVYAGVQAADGAVRGVWVFDRRTGDARKIGGTEQIAIPNDVAFDPRGNLYVTDSAFGSIWRISRNGTVEHWLQHASLEGTGALGLGAPIGANGIEYRNGTLYVANTEKSSVVAVPVTASGEPGAPSTIVTFPAVEVAPGVFVPGAPDGLAVDVHGNVYAALIALSTIVKVAPDGSLQTIAEGPPLDWPSSIAFGSGRVDRKTLFVVNFSIGEEFGDARSDQGVVTVDVGVPGMPLP